MFPTAQSLLPQNHLNLWHRKHWFQRTTGCKTANRRSAYSGLSGSPHGVTQTRSAKTVTAPSHAHQGLSASSHSLKMRSAEIQVRMIPHYLLPQHRQAQPSALGNLFSSYLHGQQGRCFYYGFTDKKQWENTNLLKSISLPCRSVVAQNGVLPPLP